MAILVIPPYCIFISSPLAGEDKGEGYISQALDFTLTLTSPIKGEEL
jgi:hypothetical protein